MTRITQNLGFFFLFQILSSFTSIAQNINILDYGAINDGKTLNTETIQRAIDHCSINGGKIVFPAGTYLTGTLYLKSNVTLSLGKGATLLGSTDLSDYPENLPAYTFFRKGIIKRALIYAEQKENIAIEGEGVIDGQGYAFKEPVDKNINSYSVRPYVIWMIQCKKIRVEGIKLQNSGLWMQHYLACENMYIHNIEVYNHSNKNNDMIDIDGCKDVIISDCRGDTDDDGITMKSTHAQPTENVTITNCIISSHCNAIKCGTESNAGFKNITISNCIIRPSKDREVIYGKPDGISGISLEVVDGAEMNGVNISNIVMDGPAVPLFIRLGNRARGYDPDLGKPGIGSLKNITISNITAFNAHSYGSSVTGIPNHPVKNLTMENIRIYYSGGGNKVDATRSVEEKETGYPEATMFGNLPAFGMFIRHAENISLKNIEFHLESSDERPPLYLEDISRSDFIDIQADISPENALVVGHNIQEIFIAHPMPVSMCKSIINISGNQSKSINLSNVQKEKFKEIFEASTEVEIDEINIVGMFD